MKFIKRLFKWFTLYAFSPTESGGPGTYTPKCRCCGCSNPTTRHNLEGPL